MNDYQKYEAEQASTRGHDVHRYGTHADQRTPEQMREDHLQGVEIDKARMLREGLSEDALEDYGKIQDGNAGKIFKDDPIARASKGLDTLSNAEIVAKMDYFRTINEPDTSPALIAVQEEYLRRIKGYRV